MPSLLVLKKLGFSCFVVVLVSSIFGAQPGYSGGNDAMPLVVNPFSLPEVRAFPGRAYRIEVPKDLFDQNELQIFQVKLEYGIVNKQGKKGTSEREIPKENLYFKSSDRRVHLFAEMPSWHEIQDIKTQSCPRGVFVPYEAHINVAYEVRGQKNIISLPIEIPNPRWAFLWGLIAVLGSLVIIWALIPKKVEREETRSKAAKFFLFPLRFAITPINTYSVSITQILLWTFVTVFGIVYVFWLTGAVLEITSQILMLLGIGGGTALAAKINAVSRVEEIPSKYLNLIERTRKPKLQDLICIERRPNIFKFQILVFTLFMACMVLVEIIKTHVFPQIPDSLVALMGISSGVYLGNEVTQRNIWEQVKEKRAEIEEIAKKMKKPFENTEQIKNLNIPEVKELEELLQEIYS